MKRLALQLLVAACPMQGIITAQAQSIYEPYSITTIAGIPPGTVDAQGQNARFDGPFGMAVDSAGNIYVADSNNDTIRRVTAVGVVTTVAGSPGMEGSTDGVGSAARFFGPKGLAVDDAGNVYVADSLNDTIRKITVDSNGIGTVSTLAGLAGISGSADGTGGPGGTARFNFPTGVAADTAGNVYVADNGNDTIRRITPAGMVTTPSGSAGMQGSVDGSGSSAQFHAPCGVTVDGSQNIYVVDSDNQTIRKITIDSNGIGTVITLAGLAHTRGSTNDPARFDAPLGVAVDLAGSSIYVADTQNSTIRKVTPAGVVSTLAGAPPPAPPGSNDGRDGAARFGKPRGIAIGRDGLIYVADTNNNTIRRVNTAGLVTTLAGLAGSGSENGPGSMARFNSEANVAVDGDGNIYVADTGNQTIRRITPTGMVTTYAGATGMSGSDDGTGSAARFFNPVGLASDADGNLYVGDKFNHTIRKIAPGAVVTTLAGTAGVVGFADGIGGAAQFNQPAGVAVDADGNVYVADSMNSTIRKITPDRVVTTPAGTPGVDGFANGIGENARFSQPAGVAVDQAGTIYVADTNNNVIRTISPARIVRSLAGLGLLGSGSVDGVGTDARFSHPKGIAVDMAGHVYVADSTNHMIRKITIDSGGIGTVDTLAGLLGRFGGADGTGSVARFHFPSGVAVDRAGTIYIADTANNIIRVGVAAPPVITSPLVASGIVGTEFAYQFGVSGATASSLDVTGLPAGFTFDKDHLTIVGNPTTAGSFLIALSATNSLGTTTATLNLTIQPAPGLQTSVVSGTGVTGSTAPNPALPPDTSNPGNPFSYQVKASVITASARVSAQGLPVGLAINPNTGLISGTLPNALVTDKTSDLVTGVPGPNGSSLVTLTVDDGVSTTTSNLQLIFTADPALPVIISSTQANVTPNQPFSYKIDAPPIAPDPLAGPTIYSYAGTLPAGLNFDPDTGTIFGTYIVQAEQALPGKARKGLSSGALNIVGSVQLFARNARGTATIPLLFTNAPPGAGNLSTRQMVGTNDDVMIGGFIVTGNAPKNLLIRALGPSLEVNGVPLPEALADPTLELHDNQGLLLAFNDDWRSLQETQISATGIPPPNDRESAILWTLEPGAYTAVLRGKNGSTGIALVEVYDLGTASLDISQDTQLANISTRGKVDGAGMIGGFIIGGSTTTNVLVRALGPELTARGVAGALPDTTLELRDANGALLAFNDDWATDQEVEILFSNVAPADPREAAILRSLGPGTYTMIARGKNNATGVALLEAYVLP